MTIQVRPGGYYSVGWLMKGRDQEFVAMLYRLDDKPFSLVYRLRYWGDGFDERRWFECLPEPGATDLERHLTAAGDQMAANLAQSGFLAPGRGIIRVEIKGDHIACFEKFMSPYFEMTIKLVDTPEFN